MENATVTKIAKNVLFKLKAQYCRTASTNLWQQVCLRSGFFFLWIGQLDFSQCLYALSWWV